MPSLHEVELNYGSQDLPDFSRPGSAAGEPIMKERALLQVSMQAPQPVLLYLFARWMLFMPGDASRPRQFNPQVHSCCGT